MTARDCNYLADSIFYVSGEFFLKKDIKHCLKNCIRDGEVFFAYFGTPVGDQDKQWTPHVICDYCRRTLEGWFRGKKELSVFLSPVIWYELSDHHTSRLLLMNGGFNEKKRKNAPSITYTDNPSSIAPVPFNTTDLLVPRPPSRQQRQLLMILKRGRCVIISHASSTAVEGRKMSLLP